MTVQLYCFGESGNAYKAALMLALSGLAWRPIWVDFFNGAHRTPEYLKLNPMGEVPVLVDGDLVLSQSGAILWHLARKTGRFAPKTPQEELEILRWLLWDNHKFTGAIMVHRFLNNFQPPEKRDAGVIGFHAARQRTALKVLEGHLKGRIWVVGESPTIADLSLCGYLYYPEPFGFDRKEWPAIDAWLSRIAALPGWRAPYDLMPRGPAPATNP